VSRDPRLDADRSARREAIDPGRSFIVPAPAGSGKTSLLTQRYLALLAGADRPEEIVAITFTRKAAAEMRHRIVEALRGATSPPDPAASDHERETRALAVAALDNSRRRSWELERHPSRLHIQTIDGLSHWLARRLPLASRLGATLQLLDDARPVHAEAARRFARRVEEDSPVGRSITRLVRLLDHDVRRLQTLTSSMLERRELWLPKVLELSGSPDPRRDMEGFLAAAVEAELSGIRSALCCPLAEELMAILRQAAEEGGLAGPLATLAGVDGLPPGERAALAQWQTVAEALLTRNGTPRKTVTRTQGFPPELKALKTRLVSRLEQLAERPEWTARLHRVRHLPPDRYTDEQWARVAALCDALVPAAAELQAVFAERGQLDHAAVAAAAREALGGPESPTELAMALEYRVRHVLVDEYQDTSPVQQALLERLVAGWQPGDGHTLFCVGDPMQSIYGFREADVTLFLEAQSLGIGDVPLRRLVLERNFRSCNAVVEWVNASFARLLPDAENYERGAVCHAPSLSNRDDEPGAGVSVHALLGKDAGAEASLVADLVENTLNEARRLEPSGGREQTVAVLVRSRGVLPPLLEELRARQIEYRGVELEGLSDRPAVRDLLALTRCLLHRGDRTAWLSVLRAPWCGLSLQDLHALAHKDRDSSIAALAAKPATSALLSPDGLQRLARAMAAIELASDDLGRRPLGSVVRAAWLALGGPATLEEASDVENVEACLVALDALARETRGLPSAAEIEAAVDGLMASPTGSSAARLQIMTIHKSKGLEFDTVILPGLDRRPPPGNRQLLYWSSVALESGRRGVLLVSRGEAGEDREPDALERWMQSLERERADYELGRIAYVAATRARRRLHLVGSASVLWRDDDDPQLKEPEQGTLLSFFWPVVSRDFEQAFAQARREDRLERPAAAARPRRTAPPIKAVPADFDLPPAPASAVPATARRAERSTRPIRPDFDWAGEEAIAVGVVVHAELEHLAAASLPPSALDLDRDRWRSRLLALGLPASGAQRALARVEEALRRVASSPLAARLLDPSVREAESELALTALLDGEMVSVKIDRSFVDEEGRRWIIDWKTSSHEGGGLEAFLQSELERYRPQLTRYSRVLSLYDARPQCVGLYFPLLDVWQELQLPRRGP